MAEHMKYRGLVVDYDNTVAQTVPDLQYPAFRYVHEKYGLGKCPGMDDYLRIDYESGVRKYFLEVCPDIRLEVMDDFTDYVSEMESIAYSGLREIFERYTELGGELFVASNSPTWTVRDNWHRNRLPEPRGIYGWDYGEGYRKPNTQALQDVYSVTGYGKNEILVLDDRMSGVKMAKALDTQCAVAGWGLVYKNGFEWMKKNSGADYFFATVKEFGDFLLDE